MSITKEELESSLKDFGEGFTTRLSEELVLGFEEQDKRFTKKFEEQDKRLSKRIEEQDKSFIKRITDLEAKFELRFEENEANFDDKIKDLRISIFQHFPTKLEMEMMFDRKLSPIKSDINMLKDLYSNLLVRMDEEQIPFMDLAIDENTQEINKLKKFVGYKD